MGFERGAFALRIGEPSEPIRGLHRRAGTSSSVFVTACNRFGRRHADGENLAAMGRLHAWLAARGIRWIAGEGRNEDGSWETEPSVLALGMGVDDAKALCVEFEQNAVVVIGEDAIPRLVFHPRAVLSRGA